MRKRDDLREFWAFGKEATEAFVRIRGEWHPTQPALPLPTGCDGFSYKGHGFSMTYERKPVAPPEDGEVGAP